MDHTTNDPATNVTPLFRPANTSDAAMSADHTHLIAKRLHSVADAIACGTLPAPLHATLVMEVQGDDRVCMIALVPETSCPLAVAETLASAALTAGTALTDGPQAT